MSTEVYYQQIQQNINLLLSEKKYKEAYNLCAKILKKFPEEKRFLKLKEKIEEEVKDENEKTISQKINEIKPFWKQEKYTEILKILRPLLKISPENSKLKNLIIKAQDVYQKKIIYLQEKFVKAQEEKFNTLINENETQFLEELFLLEKNNPGDKIVLELTNKFRNKLISKKINEKQDLIYSDKYDAIENFINQLKKIDEKNIQIIQLEKLIKSKKFGTQLEEKNEFVYNAESHLLTLMKIKKYDKAIQVADEILDIDKNNKKIYKILQKAKRKYYKQTKEEAINCIINNLDQLKSEYQKNKNLFIKI